MSESNSESDCRGGTTPGLSSHALASLDIGLRTVSNLNDFKKCFINTAEPYKYVHLT